MLCVVFGSSSRSSPSESDFERFCDFLSKDVMSLAVEERLSVWVSIEVFFFSFLLFLYVFAFKEYICSESL